MKRTSIIVPETERFESGLQGEVLPASTSARLHRPAVAPYALAALTAGGCVSVGAVVLVLLVAAYVPASVRSAVLDFLPLAAALGVLVAAGLGAWWSIAAAVRPWRIEDRERERRYSWEDRRLMQQEPGQAPEPVNLAEPAPEATSGERLQLAAFKILTLHYISGVEATRPQCEEIGITQAEWNKVNKALQALGVKGARAWRVADQSEALRIWQSGATVEPDGSVWVRKGSQSVRL